MTVTSAQHFNVDVAVGANERCRISSLKRKALLLFEFLHKSLALSACSREEACLCTAVIR
jgi:hypothetical protein